MRRAFGILLIAAMTGACGSAAGPVGAAASDSRPAAARWTSGVPVGLYFMTRFWPASGSLEKAVWYFGPDGAVYRNLATGFSEADLAAHTGKRGAAALDGDALVVSWSDGSRTSARLSSSSTGFGWDAGIFTPVKPLGDAASIAGAYEGGNSASGLGGSASASGMLFLDAGGGYRASNAAAISASSSQSAVSAGATGETTGTWAIDAYAITLTDSAGTATRLTAFPYDDPDTDVEPDYLFLGGTLYRRR